MEKREGENSTFLNTFYLFPNSEMGVTSPEVLMFFSKPMAPNQPNLARYSGSYEVLTPKKHVSVRVRPAAPQKEGQMHYTHEH